MAETPSSALPAGTAAVDFTLPDTRTNLPISLSDYAGQPLVIAFICNHCPFVVHVLDDFVSMTHEVAEKGVATIAISANDIAKYPQDGPVKMAELAADKGFDFPYCFDEAQSVAKAYDAACTPEFYLYDADHRLFYHGRYDDTRPGSGGSANGEDLRGAIAALLAGEAPPTEPRPSIGCNIKWH
ncbi:MAG: thioredoxin family protein [Gammaproteobacteria bacterium]|nr:MAG: thioredoxin family protein [Gammaproteobacteria bacterium]